jgi:hypothetical protein
MELTLYDLIDTYEFNDLKETFTECFGRSFINRAGKFEIVFDELKDKTDVILNDNFIQVNMSNLSGECSIPSGECSIPSGEWLGMRIDPESWKGYTSEEIVCKCLWEITIFGYNEERTNPIPHKLNLEESPRGLEELENIEEEKESRDILKSILRHEIESSSSSDDFIR